ncbi:hypothetical protein ACMAZF_06075 [Psychrobium sp. nBUS_13]|uniref:hypothetical protein n=1 Tax=Psychrobium sp. nBUS_13 TaxID=3395319 RepID=UPI003EBA9ABA
MKKILIALCAFASFTATAQYTYDGEHSGSYFDNTRINLSFYEGMDHSQQYFSLGVSSKRIDSIGYFEFGVMYGNEVSDGRFNTLGAGYNKYVYSFGKHHIALGAGALVTFEGKCRDNPNSQNAREECDSHDSKDSVYGSTNFMAYPEIRLMFNIAKQFDVSINYRKYFAINDGFNADKYFLGTTVFFSF